MIRGGGGGGGGGGRFGGTFFKIYLLTLTPDNVTACRPAHHKTGCTFYEQATKG